MLPCGLQPHDTTPTFLEWSLYAAGASKVPAPFHLWSSLALLAATTANRVWYEKFPGDKLYPNLYVMLLGPSGTGKGVALRRAQKYAEALDNSVRDRIQLYRGKITPQALLTRLGEKKKFPSYIWLITPELATEVGVGPKAHDFVTHMTEFYEGDYTLQDSTRMSGHFSIEDPCINWSSGTTREWLIESIGQRDILSGFFARICVVPGDRTSHRYTKPLMPHDYQAVRGWMLDYLTYLSTLGGPMTMTPDAELYHDWWYQNRPEPTDELMWNFYEHGDNLVIKLSMLNALSDNYAFAIDYHHMVNAIALYEWVASELSGVLAYASRAPEAETMDAIGEWVRRHTYVTFTATAKFASKRGITSDRLSQLIRTLIDRGDIKHQGGSTRGYKWIGN